jgi:hypothetical protein
MANPNLIKTKQIFGKTTPLVLTTSSQQVVENDSISDSIYKINTVMFSNKTSTARTATIGITRSAVFYELVADIGIPGNSSVVVISKDNGIFLEEGDSLDAVASANSAINTFVSYETITDQV